MRNRISFQFLLGCDFQLVNWIFFPAVQIFMNYSKYLLLLDLICYWRDMINKRQHDPLYPAKWENWSLIIIGIQERIAIFIILLYILCISIIRLNQTFHHRITDLQSLKGAFRLLNPIFNLAWESKLKHDCPVFALTFLVKGSLQPF